MKYKSVLFDLDGVIIDNREGIVNGYRHALKQLGYAGAETYELPREAIGPPLKEYFRSAFGMEGEKLAEAVRLYREYYRPIGLYQFMVYPGIPELLAELKAGGAAVCLATTKPREFAREILRRAGLLELFDAVAGSEMDGRMEDKSELIGCLLSDVLTPHGLPALMVGDRGRDAEGAEACGIDCAAALWGFGTKEEFLPYRSTVGLFRDAYELSTWLMEG